MAYSGFSHVDQTSNPRSYVEKLDRTGSRPTWTAIKRRMTALLEIKPGCRVLDVGCGTGDDASAIAALVGRGGLAVGIDLSQTMLSEARSRHGPASLPLAFCLTRAEGLSFAEGSFDCCRCERVLQHLERPAAAIAEMARVVRPGGRVAVAEPDYGGMTIQGADPAVTRRLIARRSGHFRSGTVGRGLALLLRAAGFQGVTITLITDATESLSPGVLDVFRESFVEPARSAGDISANDGERWLHDLEDAGRTGRFRHATPIFVAGGRKG